MLMRFSVAPLFINFNHSKITLPVSSAPPVLDVAGLDLALQARGTSGSGLLLVRLLCRDRAGRGLDHIPGCACDAVAVGLHRATRRRLEIRRALGRIRDELRILYDLIEALAQRRQPVGRDAWWRNERPSDRRARRNELDDLLSF